MKSYITRVFLLFSRYQVAIISIAAVLLLVGLSATFVWARNDNLLTVSAQREGFTELYFVDPQHLPRKTGSGQPQFSFGITNHEAKTQRYVYHIEITEDGRKRLITSGEVEIKNGQNAKVNILFSRPITDSNATVQVRLVNKPQLIQFKVSAS